jgi:hypothetical protein
MHDNSTDDSDRPPTDPPEPQPPGATMQDGFSASDLLRLAEECLSLASLTKDQEKAARLLTTADEYLHRAAEWLAQQVNKN